MKRMIYLLILCFVLSTLWACGSTSNRESVRVESGRTEAAGKDRKIRVIDVSNSTSELFDVDVIGMLWSSLDQSLQNRGILWTGGASSPSPLRLEAQIVEYQKGSIWTRGLLPMWGNTVLAVKCHVKEGDRVIASAETKQTVSIMSGGFTTGAWKKVFGTVAEDLVTELAPKL